jgi:DNA replication and repair protein RecF
MHVSKLQLQDFRNYHTLDLKLAPGSSLLYGPNAAGKTSVLEALYVLATTRSPRTTSERDLVRWDGAGDGEGSPFARLQATVQRRTVTQQLDLTLQLRRQNETAALQKTVRVDGRLTRALDLIGVLRVVLFTPTDVQLVDGPPQERRRYIDLTLSQLDPQYVRTLAHYLKVIQQRNSMLRSWRERRRPLRAVEQELAYWDEQAVQAAAYLWHERLQALSALSALAAGHYQRIAGSDDRLALQYLATHDLPLQGGPGELAAHMLQTLQQFREDELQRGQTLVGPHRDDLVFTVNGINLGKHGSRGQQRSLTLALKMAEADLMLERGGEMPLLLLDDVLSELDSRRRTELLALVQQPGRQTLITATDFSGFSEAFLRSAQLLRVEAGQVFGR